MQNGNKASYCSLGTRAGPCHTSYRSFIPSPINSRRDWSISSTWLAIVGTTAFPHCFPMWNFHYFAPHANILVHFSSPNRLGASQRLCPDNCSAVPTGKRIMARHKPASSSTRAPCSKVLNPDSPEEVCTSIFVLMLLLSLQGHRSIVPSVLQPGQLLLGSSSPITPLANPQWLLMCVSQLHQYLQGWNDPRAAPTPAY